MKKLTILIPNSRPPYVKGTETVQIKNIMSHVNEKIQTKGKSGKNREGYE